MKNYWLEKKSDGRPCANHHSIAKCKVGEPYDVSQCRICWLYYNNAKYKELWSKNEMSVNTARQIAARIWCDKEFKTQVMDPKACEEIARIILKVANK